jgi:hypothetical protein
VGGVLFFAAVVASFFIPETPDADDPTAEIVNPIADDRTVHLASGYIQGLAALLFLVFVGALWSRMRRVEADRGPSMLVALGGAGTAIIILISSGVFLARLEAADEAREPAAVRALFELDEIVFVDFGWTSAALYAGAARSSLSTRSLPRWLGFVAAGLAALFVVAFLRHRELRSRWPSPGSPRRFPCAPLEEPRQGRPVAYDAAVGATGALPSHTCPAILMP